MGYFFDLEDRAKIYANCISLTDIQKGNGSIVENKDGTVSVYMPSGPIFLSKVCCERLKPDSGYYFDLNSQKCRWTANVDTCALDNIKVTLNPDGNDGTIFYTDSVDEVCSLIIDFDYLFKVSCESLTTIMNGSDKTKEQLDVEKSVRNVQVEIIKKTADCEAITKQINELNKQIEATSYSITCGHSIAVPQVPIWNGSTGNFGNTGFSPFSLPLSDIGSILCLTDGGLNVWQNILGTDRYNKFINGDSTSYTCDDVKNIKSQNDEIVKNNTINNTNALELFFQCTTPFGAKTKLLKDLDVLNAKQTTCQSELTVLNTKLTKEQTKLLQLEPLTCSNPIDTFETLDISIALEVEDSFDNTRTIATYPLLSPIGTGNLYTYLKDNGDNSGFLVCGEPNAKELAKGITGCTPMHLNESKDVFACSGLLEHMIDELQSESQLIDKKEFLKTLDNDVFGSKFLHHNTIIDDQTIISEIINKKVKLSVRINHSCSDFCVLMDNIQLNKSCTLVTEKKMFIAQPPSFELERVIDNKKSWVANKTFTNRVFSVKNEVDTNPIRLTDYDVNDDRLIINTKEIDLDISIASGIETDVWCYIADNPCLLTALTQSNNCECVYPCFKDSFDIINYEDSNFTDMEDLFTTIRAVRDAWLKALNQRDLAVGPNYTVNDSPYSVFVNPNTVSTKIETQNAYYKANEQLSLAQGAYIYGVTERPNIDVNQPTPFIIKTECGDLMVIHGSALFIYCLANKDNELEIYIQDVDNYWEPSTRLVSLNNYITIGNPTGYATYSGTPQLFCSNFAKNVNDINSMNLAFNEYYVNDNVEVKGTGNSYDYRDFLTIQWDSQKGKCMARSKNALPEAFGVLALKQNCEQWCKRYGPSFLSTGYEIAEECIAKCNGDITYNYGSGGHYNLITTVTGKTTYMTTNNYIISGVSDTTSITVGDYVYGDGITWGSRVVSKTSNTLEVDKICTLTLDNVSIQVWDGRLNDIYSAMAEYSRGFRDFNLKHINNFRLATQRIYFTAVEDINGDIPDEPYTPSLSTNMFIPVDVTATFRKGAVDGPIVYQESYRLNDPSGLEPANRPSGYGLGMLSLPLGSQDPNGFINSSNFYASDYFGPPADGTYITGSTADMPFFNSGKDTVSSIDYKDNYYVHLDIIDTSGNTYYASNNDFNLKDASYLRKFPTTASTQTFDINNVLNNIEEKKQEFIGARDYILNLIIKNGRYIGD
jgi:hypothetical protein